MSTLSRELGFLARRNLAQILDLHSSTGIDWRGLVDKMGFSYEMNMLLSTKPSPTLSLLEEWERVLAPNVGGWSLAFLLRQLPCASATLDKLIELVGSLGCKEGVDILLKAKGERKTRLGSKGSLSGSCSSSGSYNSSPLSTSPWQHNDTHPMNGRNSSSPTHRTIHPHMMSHETHMHRSHDSHMTHTHNGVDPHELTQHMERLTLSVDDQLQKSLAYVRSKQFDVFLSFSQDDEEFAEEVRSRLTTQAHMRVFVPSDDLMPGKVFSEQIADMIKSGCRKTLVLLSPKYLESEWCSYEARMALHESPDSKKHVLIPILYKSCDVPNFLQHIYYLDYPRYHNNPVSCQKFFWARLFRAVNFVPRR